MSNSAWGLPVAVATTVPASSTVAETVTPLVAYVFTVSRSRELSTSGMMVRFFTPELSTGSSHTGCQMPEEEVYMIPPGYKGCLPRGSPALSSGL